MSKLEPFKEFEDDIAKRLKALDKTIKESSSRLTKLADSLIKSPSNTPAYWKELQTAIDKEYDTLAKAFTKWAEAEMPVGYSSSLKLYDAKLKADKALKDFAKATNDIEKLLSSKSVLATADLLKEDAIASFVSSLTEGKKNFDRLIRITKQTLISESFIDTAVAEGIESGNIKKAADMISSALYSKLADAADNGQFIQVGSRKFTPEYYAELVARTKFHDAQALAALQTAKNYETDLVIVSSHNTTTPICSYYEGKIFSISGKDTRFPVLDQAPPFHPNCLHLLYPQFESALEASGTLEQYVDFSNGDVSVPPGPSNFIPVSEREMK